jgi:GntR family transcriptional regulator
MPAIFSLDPHTGVPIYLQLIEQIKKLIALGVLKAGERLPTVKRLAAELTINPNTVARAYRELERAGFIETSVGRGSFVRSQGPAGKATQAVSDLSASALDAAVREARSLGLGRERLVELFDRAMERWYAPAKRRRPR